MAFEHEEGGEDVPGRPPPSPDDRLWRHPSEVGRSIAPSPRATGDGTSRRLLGVAVAGACLTGAALACGALWLTRPSWVREATTTTTAARTVAPTAVAYAAAAVPTRELAEQLAPSLVRVDARTGATRTAGTGIWIDPSHVLVVVPVVEGAAEVAVTDVDHRRSIAHVRGADAATQAAVLAVDDAPGASTVATRSAPLASPALPGQAVAVVGARSGSSDVDGQRIVPTTVSDAGVRTALGDVVLHDAIQLDRSLPDDALGAAVADADGDLIGVVVDVEDDDGLALAVPARDALAAARQLAETGEVRRAWLGVRAVDLDPSSAEPVELDGGAVVTSVQAGSPAATAGLARGDTITTIDDTAIDDASDLVLAIRHGHPGDEVRLTWWRAGEAHRADVVLGG